MRIKLHHLATQLLRIRSLFTLLAVSAFVGFIVLTLAGLAQQHRVWLFTCILCLMWSLLATLFIHTFANKITPNQQSGIWARLKYRLIKWGQNFIIALFCLALAVSLLMTYRLINFGF